MAVQFFLNHLNLVLGASEITHLKAYFDLPWPWYNSRQIVLLKELLEFIELDHVFLEKNLAFLRAACGRTHWVMHLLTSQRVSPVIIAKNGGESRGEERKKKATQNLICF